MSQLYVDGPARIYVGTLDDSGNTTGGLISPRAYVLSRTGQGGFGYAATSGTTGKISGVTILSGGSGYRDGDKVVVVGTGKGGVELGTFSGGAWTGTQDFDLSENYRGGTARVGFEFLGWTEGPVEIDLGTQFDDGYPTDVGAPGEVFVGSCTASVSCVLKRFNYAAYLRAASLTPRSQTSSPFGRGSWDATLGVSAKDSGVTFPLVIASPYVTDKSFYSGMPGGYHFVHAAIARAGEPVGVRAKRVPVSFRCWPHVDERANVGLLYTLGVPTPILPAPN